MRIEATHQTPLIQWDLAGNTTSIVISGVSIPENAYLFFKPLEDFIQDIDPHKYSKANVIMRLEYMNSLSSKAILDYLRIMKMQKSMQVKVVWEYFSDDDEMREYGESFSEIVDIPFNYKKVEPSERKRGGR